MHDLFLHFGFQKSKALKISSEVDVLFSQNEMASSYSCHFVTTFYSHAGRNLLFEQRERDTSNCRIPCSCKLFFELNTVYVGFIFNGLDGKQD